MFEAVLRRCEACISGVSEGVKRGKSVLLKCKLIALLVAIFTPVGYLPRGQTSHGLWNSYPYPLAHLLLKSLSSERAR